MAGSEKSSQTMRSSVCSHYGRVTSAQRIAAGDDYPDFFVEGSGPPWHERWHEAMSAGEMTEERMLFVERLAFQDDYPDFFVEGSAPPWHERWPEAMSGSEVFDPANVQQPGIKTVWAFENRDDRRRKWQTTI
jgi:hypothetical protein